MINIQDKIIALGLTEDFCREHTIDEIIDEYTKRLNAELKLIIKKKPVKTTGKFIYTGLIGEPL